MSLSHHRDGFPIFIVALLVLNRAPHQLWIPAQRGPFDAWTPFGQAVVGLDGPSVTHQLCKQLVRLDLLDDGLALNWSITSSTLQVAALPLLVDLIPPFAVPPSRPSWLIYSTSTWMYVTSEAESLHNCRVYIFRPCFSMMNRGVAEWLSVVYSLPELFKEPPFPAKVAF